LNKEFILLQTGHAQQTRDQLLNLFLLVVEVQAVADTLGHTTVQAVVEQVNLLKDG
jgi:hypothetical protein